MSFSRVKSPENPTSRSEPKTNVPIAKIGPNINIALIIKFFLLLDLSKERPWMISQLTMIPVIGAIAAIRDSEAKQVK